MKRADILAVVAELVARHLPAATPREAIREPASIVADLHVSSVRIVDLIIDLEDRFGFLVEDWAIDGLRTVGQIVDYIEKRLAKP